MIYFCRERFIASSSAASSSIRELNSSCAARWDSAIWLRSSSFWEPRIILKYSSNYYIDKKINNSLWYVTRYTKIVHKRLIYCHIEFRIFSLSFPSLAFYIFVHVRISYRISGWNIENPRINCYFFSLIVWKLILIFKEKKPQSFVKFEFYL